LQFSSSYDKEVNVLAYHFGPLRTLIYNTTRMHTYVHV